MHHTYFAVLSSALGVLRLHRSEKDSVAIWATETYFWGWKRSVWPAGAERLTFEHSFLFEYLYISCPPTR
jgi:hypothetical protein